MSDGPQGKKVYTNVLQSARSNGDPIGPEYHLYDKHLKEWLSKNKPVENVKKINKKESKEIIKKLDALKAFVASVPVTVGKTKEQALKEKYKQMQKRKIADSLKTYCPCAHIKSVGNGL